VIAIIQREPGWQQIRSQLEQANLLRISAGTLQELLVVAHCRGVLEAVEELLLLLDADVVPVDEDLARRACRIFQRFGKGQGHGAQLNFGDCFAAALAEREQCPLACVGEDFRSAGF
jgi:ribonuclease VapC